MIEEALSALSATQENGKQKKTRKTEENAVPDMKPVNEHDEENRKVNFRRDLDRSNGLETIPLDLSPGFVFCQVIKDWQTQRRVFSTKEIDAERKANGWWLYIMYNPDGKGAVIDYDKDKGKPYVKAFLARVNKLLEVTLIRIGLWMQGGHIFLSLAFFAILFYSIASIKEDMKTEMRNAVNSQIEQVRKEFLEKTIQAPDPTETVQSDKLETAKPQGLENSHPGRLVR